MSASLPETARDLLDRPEFATVATIEPDGQPHLSVVWVGRDGDDVLFSTLRGRRKTNNLERDGRATVLVYPKDDPYKYLEIRGTATLVDDPDAALIDAMSHKYEGTPWTGGSPGDQRVVVRVTPTKVVWYA
ncbi:MAG: PPOX class F420-dependent oxidoreductase [Actinobacteria bacterium]|nr:PPOX class F420-dependent oxidoreductase [Actinomycetota bacterium]